MPRRMLLAWLAGVAFDARAAGAPASPPAAGIAARMRADLGIEAGAARERLLAEGEALLASGDTTAAQQVLQQASQMLHAPDTELSLVRAQMQGGDYRRAVAFCAHAAGAHRDLPAGQALYAWLLHVGGQTAAADRLLSAALLAAPGDAALVEARRQLASAWPRADGVLRQLPWRIAPYGVAAAGAAAMPAGLAITGSATLVAAGAKALVPTPHLRGGERAWVRNGLGQTVSAQAEARSEPLGLTLLALAPALPDPGVDGVGRPPFAGSPGALAEYAPDEGGQPAWPLLRTGFIGRVVGADGLQLLGIEAPSGPRGGPVLDGAGRMTGIASADARGKDVLIPWSAIASWGAAQGVVPSPPPPAGPVAGRIGEDALYEIGMRASLQLLVPAA